MRWDGETKAFAFVLGISWACFAGKLIWFGSNSTQACSGIHSGQVPLLLEALTAIECSRANLGHQNESTVSAFNRKKQYAKSAIQQSIQGGRFKIDLNTVDSATLESLPHLGPVLAGRICKYRAALGGFFQLEQLREVWGLRPEVADEIIPWFELKSGVHRFLCADTASWRELRRHPYIGSREATSIERYRNHHMLDSIQALAGSISITDSMIRKWSPYLRICE